jgi:hypothetical protein
MNSPSVKSTLPSAIILASTGWLGLFYLIQSTLPTLGPRWLFFFLSVIAVTGLFLPIVAFLNLRFPTKPVATRGVIVREASMVGILFTCLAWLQLGRVLTMGLGVLVTGCLVLIEILIRIREKSRWVPSDQ